MLLDSWIAGSQQYEYDQTAYIYKYDSINKDFNNRNMMPLPTLPTKLKA